LCFDAAVPAPLAHGELGLADQPGKFVRAVPILDRLLLDKHGKGGLNLRKSLH
jgi:hypothetical protein